MSATKIHVAKKGVRYTVTWKGKAAAWRVTLKVGAKKVAAKVKGTVHKRAFTIRGVTGKPHATVKSTTLKTVKKNA